MFFFFCFKNYCTGSNFSKLLVFQPTVAIRSHYTGIRPVAETKRVHGHSKRHRFSLMPAGEYLHPSPPPPPHGSAEEEEWVWNQIKVEARCDADAEPALASYLYSTILSHSSLERSLSFHLGNKLCCSTLLSTLLYDLFLDIFSNDATLRSATVADLRAARFRDPACVSFSHCLLNYKGFLACQVVFFSKGLGTWSSRNLC